MNDSLCLLLNLLTLSSFLLTLIKSQLFNAYSRVEVPHRAGPCSESKRMTRQATISASQNQCSLHLIRFGTDTTLQSGTAAATQRKHGSL